LMVTLSSLVRHRCVIWERAHADAPPLSGVRPRPGQPTPGLEPATPSTRVMDSCRSSPLESLQAPFPPESCELEGTGADWVGQPWWTAGGRLGC
jgi:hypothetical protein